MNDDNSYPFNRIILDIVELLQDLRGQGMAFLAALNSSGSFDFSLFTDKDTLDKWSVSDVDCKDYRAICQAYIMHDDISAAHMAWNELIKYKEATEFDLETILSKAEYEEER